MLTEAAVTGEVLGLRALNAQAIAWCTEVNAAVPSEICAVPDQRLAEERHILKPLPSFRLEIEAASVRRKVNGLSCIRYGSARNSVPTRSGCFDGGRGRRSRRADHRGTVYGGDRG